MAFQASVNLPVQQAAQLVKKAICDGSFSAELIDENLVPGPGGTMVLTLMFDKYYMRVSNHCALMVSIENLRGYTSVYAVSAGSKQGMLSIFDWGAGDSFEDEVRSALSGYLR